MKETTGQRIRRMRKSRGEDQVPFGKKMGVGQGTVSAWERDDKDRAPSADMYFRLAILAAEPDDQAYFLQKAGLSGSVILSAADKIKADRSAPPSEGEIFRVPIVRRVNGNTEETGELFPVANSIIGDQASVVCLSVDDTLGPRLVPSGSKVLLDTSDNDAPDLCPFWGRLVLFDIDAQHPHGRMTQIVNNNAWPDGLNIGTLRCEKSELGLELPFESESHYLIWKAHLSLLTDSETLKKIGTRGDLILGGWMHPATGQPGTREEQEKLAAEATLEAYKHVRVDERCKLLGRVIAYFPQQGVKA